MSVIFKCLWTKISWLGKRRKAMWKDGPKKILADPVDWFAFKLDRLALKKSPNNLSLRTCKEKLWRRTSKKKKKFIEINEKNNFKDRGKVKDYKKFYYKTSQQIQVVKIRVVLHSRVKRGKGLVPSNEPLWFKHVDPLFSETNSEIRLNSPVNKTFFNEEDSRENTIQT